MSYSQRATFDEVRSLAAGSIVAGYTAIGDELWYRTRIIWFVNTTDADLMLTDNTAKDKLVIPSGGTAIFDISTNNVQEVPWFFAAKSTWYVKRIGTPSSGSIYMGAIFGRND